MRRPVHHFDLYRLTSHESLGNLDLQDSFSRGVCVCPLSVMCIAVGHLTRPLTISGVPH